jgi:hypothetical protein
VDCLSSSERIHRRVKRYGDAHRLREGERYFRFNSDGLEGIDLDQVEKIGDIRHATEGYMNFREGRELKDSCRPYLRL